MEKQTDTKNLIYQTNGHKFNFWQLETIRSFGIVLLVVKLNKWRW